MADKPKIQEIEPEFRQRYREIFDQWQAGQLPFKQAVDQMMELKKEAISAGQYANQGAIENNIGIMQGYRANLDEGIRHFERARELYEQAGNREHLISTILNLGETYRLKGNFTRAQRYFHAASEASRDIGRIFSQAVAITNEAQISLSMGHLDRARQRLEEALKLCENPWDEPNARERDRIDNLCEVHHALATICLDENKPQEAWKHAKAALDNAEKIDAAIRVGYANRAIADVITELGKAPEEGFSDDPDEYYKKSIDAFREVKAEGESARTLFAQAHSLGKRGKKRRAARLFQQVMIIFTKLGMTDDAAKAAQAQLEIL